MARRRHRARQRHRTAAAGNAVRHCPSSTAMTSPVSPIAMPSPGCVGCCDHVQAAKEGHIECLQWLEKAGRFHRQLSWRYGMPGWENDPPKGEAGKLQAWEAVMAACEAGQPVVLFWILLRRPADTLNVVPWGLRDTVPEWDRRQLDAARFLWRLYGNSEHKRLRKKIPEIALCRAAVTSPSQYCVRALLETGYRSPWLCVVAAMEGKPRHYWAAVKAGCRSTIGALQAAAVQGNAVLLKALCRKKKEQFGPKCRPASKERYLQVLRAAICGGHVTCMEVVVRAYSCCVMWETPLELSEKAMEYAAELGQLDCLKAARRLGGQVQLRHICTAARHAQEACLTYLVHCSSNLLTYESNGSMAMRAALEGGSLACIAPLRWAACTWKLVGPPGTEAAFTSNPAPVCIPNMPNYWGPFNWGLAVKAAFAGQGTPTSSLLSLLYKCGLESHRPRSEELHPARLALTYGNAACVKLAVERSGLPAPNETPALTLLAALEGGDMLQWVLGQGLALHPYTAIICARNGDARALTWLLETAPDAVAGPENAAMCEAAVLGNSLECLRFARRRGYLMGSVTGAMTETASACMNAHHWPVDKYLLTWSAKGVGLRLHWDLEMLQYLVRHMEPQWAGRMLRQVADALEHALAPWKEATGGEGQVNQWPAFRNKQVKVESDIEIEEVPWRVIVFLAKSLKKELPEGLSRMAAVRSQRARALACVAYDARRLSKEERAHPALQVWKVMARVPSELWERIACEAHLAVPALNLPL